MFLLNSFTKTLEEEDYYLESKLDAIKFIFDKKQVPHN